MDDHRVMLELSLFIIGLIGATYSYFIYPLILLVLPKRHKNGIAAKREPEELPPVSFIITAFNEQANIEDKVLNTLAVDYPKDQLEIIVASDGSTDKTNDIVRSFADRHVVLAEVNEQKGKENAQNYAIALAKHDILVFSDVSTRIDSNAIHIIVDAFKNTQVGAISSEDRFIAADGEIAGEGAYVKYEMWLRKLEGQVNSLVGLSGSFFAARKSICQNWDISIPSDFNTALNCVVAGKTAQSIPELLGYYPNLSDESKEYQRKLRTVIRGMAALVKKKSVLNPFKFGLFAFQLFSHKVMRWLVPWFLILLFVSNLMLIDSHWVYQLFLAGQVLFYLVTLLAFISSKLREKVLFKIPYFFIQVNIAIAHATIQFLTGKRVTRWTPSKR